MKIRILVTAAIVAVPQFFTGSQAHAQPATEDFVASSTMRAQSAEPKVGDSVRQVLDGEAATYTLVAEEPNWGQRVRLWRNTSNGNLHGQIAFSKPGDSVWLTGTGCNGASSCNLAYVPSGSDQANTVPVNRSVDVCGRHRYSDGAGTTVSCSCIVCKASPRKPANRPDQLRHPVPVPESVRVLADGQRQTTAVN